MGLPRFLAGDLADATYGATYDNTAFPLVNLKNYDPLTPWTSTSTADGQVLTITFATVRPRDFCVIDTHNLGGMTVVSLEAASDAGFTADLVTAVPNAAQCSAARLLFTFPSIARKYWRVNFLTAAGIAPSIGQIFIDQSFTVPDAYDLPWQPSNEIFVSKTTVSKLGTSRGVQSFAGRVSRDFKFTVRNTQFRQDFLWFHQRVRGAANPFYFFDVDDQSYYVKLVSDQNSTQVDRYNVNSVAKVTLATVRVGQVPIPQLIRPMAVNLDGSSKHLYKTGPCSVLDFGDADLVTNRFFESDASGWSGQGNHSVARSTVDKHTGVASLLVTSSGAGNFLNNALTAVALVAGNKYCSDIWVKSNTGNTSLVVATSAGQQLQTFTITASWARYAINAAITASAGYVCYWLNGAGTFYLDDVSFAKCYDYSVLLWFNASQQASSYTRLITYNDGGVTVTPFDIMCDVAANRTMNISFGDGTTTIAIVPSTNTWFNGAWHLLVATFQRDGLASVYIDGVICPSGTASMAALGSLKVTSNYYFVLGRSIPGAGPYFKGFVGECQVVRGYAATAADIALLYTRGISRGWGEKALLSQVVAHFKWRGGTLTDFLRDESGYNNLIANNVSQLDQYQFVGGYPIAELNN